MAAIPVIAAAGAGRMGRGIAIVFAFAGHQVHLVDMKARDERAFDVLKAGAEEEIRTTLSMLADFNMLPAGSVDDVVSRVSIYSINNADTALKSTEYIFEAVPETLKAKREAFALISAHAAPDAIIASTTSTILSTDLENFVSHPERFLNAHWLNPAFLVPLVELSPASATNQK